MGRRRTRSMLQNLPMTLLLLSVCIMKLVSGIARTQSTETRCVEREKRALLQFKIGIRDDYGILSSWGRSSQDCCSWRGVGCNNITNHVEVLDLHGYWSDNLTASVSLTGEINSSLLELQHLKHLDLSYNGFTRIPPFIGSFKKLRYLNLSFLDLDEFKVPPQLGNLSYLQCLDLAESGTILKDTDWLSKLSSLEYLSLHHVDVSKSENLLRNVLTKLPSLFELRLSDSSLPELSANPLISVTNFSSSISILDISYNYLQTSSIYPWLFNFSESLAYIDLSHNLIEYESIPEAFGGFGSLQHLYMSYNGFEGGIPRSFGNLTNLESLYLDQNNLNGDLSSFFHNLSGPAEKSIQILELSMNKLSGSLPDFTTFTALRELHLQNNELNGSFPEKFEKISNLFVLDLANNRITGFLPDLFHLSSLKELYFEINRIEGTIAEKIMPLSKLQILGASSNRLQDTISKTHLTNLSHLTYLDISYNSLVLELYSDWTPSFSLDVMLLSSCKLGPSFPTWLQTQKNLSIIDISNAQIKESVPSWFWEQLTPSLHYLNLSFNQIHGIVPDLMSGNEPFIDLSSNNFLGPIPLFPSNTQELVLYNNMFSGSVSFLCSFTNIGHLDLSNNKLSGELPDCWINLSEALYILNLENNNFSGRIPASLGFASGIIMLSMRNNALTGKLPSSLKNCTMLQVLDLGENNLSGRLPAWIGKSQSELRVLSLPSNGFHGNIPKSFCRLASIQILDISINNISGTIPRCLSNLQSMSERKTKVYDKFQIVGLEVIRSTLAPSTYVFKAWLQWKGRKSEYRSTLGLVTSLDLSSNRLMGEIPGEITNLSGLVALNLSRNNLTSKIPQDIGRLRWLDFLDLSRNHLVGSIPASLSQLTKIGVLDVSNNNLSGRIPTSTQLQSFDASSYSGNPTLCGVPLPNSCPGDLETQKPPTTVQSNGIDDEKDELITREFFIGLLIGLAFGFWGVCGTLVVNDSWRYAYFESWAMSKIGSTMQ